MLAGYRDRRCPISSLSELRASETQRQKQYGQERILGRGTEKKKTGNETETGDTRDPASPPETDTFAEAVTPKPPDAGSDCTDNPRNGGEVAPFQDFEFPNIDEVDEEPVEEDVEDIVHAEIARSEQQDVSVLEHPFPGCLVFARRF